MMRALVIVALLLAGSAHAATLPELRAGVASAGTKVTGIRGQRSELQKSLDDVARQIEALKGKPGSVLFGNPELDRLLKRSQDLSARVAEALKAESEAAELLRSGQGRLADELDQELARLRTRWESASRREDRQELTQKLRALRAERDALRGSAPDRTLPATVADRPSTDPEELLERADALLDSEDKLRREEQALARRIEELRTERELERRMDEFLSEDALFDEHDRRLSTVLTVRGAQAETGQLPAGTSDSGKTPGAAVPNPVGAPVVEGDPTSAYDSVNGRYGEAVPASPSGKTSGTPSASGTGSLGRQDGAEELGPAATRVGVSRAPPERRQDGAAYSDDEDLEELVARRAQVRKLAEELHRKAQETVRQARQLSQ